MKQDLFSIINLQNIELNSKLCMNFQNKNLVCHECTDSCPTNALELVNNLPVLNTSKCTNCGYCISKCDVLAFDNRKIPYNEIINQINQYPNSNITCDNANNHVKGIKIPCYLNMDLNTMLQLSKYKNSISLYVGDCSTCLKAEYETIYNHITDLQKQIDNLGIQFTIQTNKSKLDEKDSETINGMSRRELFQKISLKKLRNFNFNEESNLNRNKSTKLLLKEKNLYKRGLFNTYFEEKKNQVDINNVKQKFISIETSDLCNGCGICEKICPTNAITWHDNLDATSSLMFDTRACIACKKCEACPEDAIIFKSISFNEFVNSELELLATFNLAKCEKCDDFFRSKDDFKTCSLCTNELDKSSNRFFN